MHLAVFPWQFTLVAREPIFFPPGKAANVLRGGFGTLFRRMACSPVCPGPPRCERRSSCPYARLFEPSGALRQGPSGLASLPRPFVLRAFHLDGKRISPGETFEFGLHLFSREHSVLPMFSAVFTELAREGLGATRGKADLERATAFDEVDLTLDTCQEPTEKLLVQFLTPTELKAGDGLVSRPDFPALFARARDRVSTLASLYGTGAPRLEYRGMGERSQAIRLTHCAVHHVDVERRSSRTGQRHPLGGFVGEAAYEGNLTEFVPILKAAEWTGVGRHTVWGKGQIRCSPGA